LPAAPEKPLQRIVCYVTDRNFFHSTDPVGSMLAHIRTAIAAGVDWVQIREKDLPGRELLALVRAVVGMANDRASKARVIVNDRLDVALAAGARGVHLGDQSLPAREIVRWCRAGNVPAGFLVGVSSHGFERAREAEDADANYVFFGPIFDTPAKKSFGAPQGIPKLAEVCRSVRIPVIAIGGVNKVNSDECLRAGAAGIAAIRLFQEPREPVSLKATVEGVHNFV
jgi:thiamine-phosphate pyrophosphorylase